MESGGEGGCQGRHVAALLNGAVGHVEAAESLSVRAFKGQVVVLAEVKPRQVAFYSFGEAEGVQIGRAHV